MCEPTHSVIQYSDRNDSDSDNFGGYQMDPEVRLKACLGDKVVSWGKKIRNWFHFSKLGSGHHAAIELDGRRSLYLSTETRYEGFWWERSFKVDGHFGGHQIDRDLALQSAKDYHTEVVMGSMSKFRRFFETSVNKSNRSYLYVRRFFEQVLTPAGRDQAYQKLKMVFGRNSTVERLFGVFVAPEEKALATKCVMGFTRKRGLFLPHWADDNQLWTPGS